MLGITRQTKRLIIVSIFLLIIIVVGVTLYIVNRPTPTCFDKKLNQNETGVDCGGVCALVCVETVAGDPLLVKDVAALPATPGVYDVIGTVMNPNASVGASSFHYLFSMKDSTGKELVRTEGDSWILPSETKTMLAFNLASSVTPAKTTLEISGTRWAHLSNYTGKPNLNIYEKRYNQISSGVGFGEALGTLSNESPYDFRLIMVKVILRDSAGKPLALQETQVTNMKANERQDFRVFWPSAFPGTVENVDIETDADVFSSDNFVKQFLPGGDFQKSGASSR